MCQKFLRTRPAETESGARGVKMGWRWGALCCFGVWSCVLPAPCVASGRLWSEGLHGCDSISTLEVSRGDSRSLNLSLNEDWQILVKKWDPETKTWKEEMLVVLRKDNSLTGKTHSISLVNRNFVVQNAEKTEEGLYKIERHLDNSCLAVVNVTVRDLPLPVTVMPSLDVSLAVTSNITETPEASPSGGRCIAITVSVSLFILIAIVIAIGLSKSKCRRNEATSEVDPEKLMNGLQPPQQEEITTV